MSGPEAAGYTPRPRAESFDMSAQIAIQAQGETPAVEPQSQPSTLIPLSFTYTVASFGSPGKAVDAARRAVEKHGGALDSLAES